MTADPWQDFLRALSALSPGIDALIRREADAWAGEAIPSTVLAGHIGRFLSENFDELDPRMMERVFALIEEAAAGRDRHLGTVVCTGLLEALLHSAETRGTWQAIEPHLGPESTAYVEAWIEFTGAGRGVAGSRPDRLSSVLPAASSQDRKR